MVLSSNSMLTLTLNILSCDLVIFPLSFLPSYQDQTLYFFSLWVTLLNLPFIINQTWVFIRFSKQTFNIWKPYTYFAYINIPVYLTHFSIALPCAYITSRRHIPYTTEGGIFKSFYQFFQFNMHNLLPPLVGFFQHIPCIYMGCLTNKQTSMVRA